MTSSPLSKTVQFAKVPSTSTEYRSDIDGLRAFSILSVIAFHAFPQIAPGGFIGVDVFFVISGFLISGIIFKSLSIQSFSYRTFYSRRIKRIFPALIVVLIASLVAGWFFLFPSESKNLGKHAFAGALFSSNILQMREAGYFNSPDKPLLHLWSLGIEEQFYIFWPLVLAIVWKQRRSALLPFLLLVILASFVLNISFVNVRPSTVFYFPATRFWELALGSVLAYIVIFSSGSRWHQFSLHDRRLSSALSICGLALLAASTLLINKNHPYPGVWALLPTSGAFLTIAAGPKAWFNRTVLSSPPMVFLGLISYPLYLWHWPILVFAKILSPSVVTPGLAIFAILSSTLLAFITYRVVENPIRHHRSRSVVPWALAASVVAIGLFGLSNYHRGFSRLQTARDQLIYSAFNDWDYPFVFNFRKNKDFHTGQVGHRAGGQTMFIGDSHAEHFYSRVKLLAQQEPDSFPTTIFATYAGCPPLPKVNRVAPGYACDKFFEYAMAQARDPRIRTIVFSAFWEYYFGYAPDGDSGLVYSIRDGPGSLRPGTVLADLAFHEFASSIRLLTGSGKRVFIMLSTPSSRFYNPRFMLSRFSSLVQTHDVDRATLETARPIRDKLIAIAAQSGATIIDPIPFFCRGTICRTLTEDGQPLYRDDDHLRSSYAARYATFIDRVFTQ